MLQAFFDESGNWGISDTDHVFVIAGFLSTAERWAAFTRDWEQSGLSPALKMATVLRQASDHGKPDYLEHIVSMIEKYAMYRVESSIHIPSFIDCVSITAREKKKINPYLFTFHTAISRLATTVISSGQHSQEIEIVFDGQDRYGRINAEHYQLARGEIMLPRARAVLPSRIEFKRDDECIPLKAADLLAGLARRDHNGDVHLLETYIDRINEIPCIGSQTLEIQHLDILLSTES